MKRRILLLVTVFGALLLAGVAYAATAGEFKPRAQKWAAHQCTAHLLKSSATPENNEKVALCYALLQLEEDATLIGNLSSQVGTLNTQVGTVNTQVANLEKEVHALQGKAAPEDFTFFKEDLNFSDTSSVFDAKDFTHVVFSAACGIGGEAQLTVEVSADQSTWIPQTGFKCNGAPHEALPTAARYYRVSFETTSGTPEVTIVGRFSA